MKFPKNMSLILILLIIAVSVFFRVYFWKFKYLFDSDPYFHIAVINLIDSNKGVFPEHYNLTYYPEGREILEPQGLYYIVYFIYKIISVFGVDIIWAVRLSQLICGITCVFLTYLIGSAVFNKETGLISSSLLAVSIANIYRTSNHYRGDPFFLLFFLLGLYSLILSFKNKKTLNFLVSGIFFGLTAWVWNGYPFMLIVVLVTLLFFNIFNKDYNLLKQSVMLSSVYAVIFLLKSFNMIKQTFFLKESLILAIGVILYSFLISKIKIKQRWFFLIPTFLVIPLIYFLAPVAFSNLVSGQGLLIAQESFMKTVSEMQPPSYDFLFTVFNIVIFLFAFGLIFLFINYKKSSLLIPWFVFSSLIIFTARRFSFLASPALCLLSGLLLAQIFSIKFPSSKKFIPIAIILAVLFCSAFLSYTNLSLFSPLLNDKMYEAMLWIKNNTAENATFTGFWDRLAFIEGIAGRATYIDSVNQAPERVDPMNVFFLTNSTLPEPKADYLIVDTGLLLNIAAMQYVGYKDFAMTPFTFSSFVNEKQARFVSPAGVMDVFTGERPYAVFYKNNADYISKCLMLKDGRNLWTIKAENLTESTRTLEGCVFVEGNLAVWVSNSALNSNLFNLMFLGDYKQEGKYKLEFDNFDVKIYKVL